MSTEPGPQTIRDAIEARRRETGDSDERAARAVDVAQTTFSKWRKGLYVPRAENIVGLARWLDVTPAVVVTLIEQSRSGPDDDLTRAVSLLAEIPARLDDLEARMSQLERHAR